MNWQPAAPGANSLYALVVHMLGTTEENLLGLLVGQPMPRGREAEFVVEAGSASVFGARWGELRPRLAAMLTALTPAALDQTYNHPRRGAITGRDVLIVVARHAVEHLGQAELTRDLLRAAR
ncbi:MAG TPA: DinB family protein [Thermomicrobiales bacterium]|nr:DinB family protein [Thermomicrobiales bacterium]